MARYKPYPRKGVTLGQMEGRVSDDGTSILVKIIDTPVNLSPGDASDLHEVLTDLMEWDTSNDRHSGD